MPALAHTEYRSESALDLGLPEEIARAVIVHRGRLTERFAYLQTAVEAAAERAY